MRVSQAVQWISLQACLLLAPVSAFTPVAVTRGPTESTTASQQQQSRSDSLRTLVASAVLASSLLVGAGAYADELGVEVEAPTMFTGEEIMVRAISWTTLVSLSVFSRDSSIPLFCSDYRCGSFDFRFAKNVEY